MRLLALSAKAGCGKTTTANMLLEMIPGAVRISFGDPVKTEVSETYGVPIELCYSEAGKKSMVFIGAEGFKNFGKYTMSVRELMQNHGMMRREEDADYWVKLMAKSLAHTPDCQAIIIDDVRMPNEVTMVRDFDGSLYRLQPYPGWTPGKNADHISETALDAFDGWDMVFCPEKGMEQLRGVASQIVSRIGKSCAAN